jgi:4-hydroxybenzoyl-CoA reductase subunit beta
MRLTEFAHFSPKSVADALGLLEEDGAVLKAGGTDLIPQMKWRMIAPSSVIGLKNLRELEYVVKDDDGTVRIGALTTLRDIRLSSSLNGYLGSLRWAASQVGSPEIQNMGTIGGNICLGARCSFYNQPPLFRQSCSPCRKMGGDVCYMAPKRTGCYALFSADIPSVLIVLEAKLRLRSLERERIVEADDFYTGDGKTPLILESNELLTEVIIPRPTQHVRTSYLKYRLRNAIDFPMVGAAVALPLGEGTERTQPRIVVGGATARPFRCLNGESQLKGSVVNRETAEAVAEIAAREIPLVSSSGCSVPTRRRLARQLVLRAILSAAQQGEVT